MARRSSTEGKLDINRKSTAVRKSQTTVIGFETLLISCFAASRDKKMKHISISSHVRYCYTRFQSLFSFIQ